jgi:hypothetical protein
MGELELFGCHVGKPPFGFMLCLNNQMKELFDDGSIVAWR